MKNWPNSRVVYRLGMDRRMLMRFFKSLVVSGLLGTLSMVCTAQIGPVPISGDVPEAQGWRTEIVVEGLSHPWSIAWLPDGAALVTERPGRLRLIRNGHLDQKPVTGLPPVLAFGQGGLLDIALHPDFAKNRWIYLTMATGSPEANRTALVRGRLENHTLQDAKIIFQNADPKSGGQHFGSRLVWLPDRTLLMSIGDGGNPPTRFGDGNIRDQAQNPGTHFGKVLRLKDDGTPPVDNPFVNRPGAKPEIWTFGHRNIQGLTRHPLNGRIWANEHGSRGGDELNILESGRNYGWPVVTYSFEYWGPKIADETHRPGIADPQLVWTPSKAPSGLTFYTGDVYPRQIRRIDMDGDRIMGEQKLTMGKRVRDVRQGPDGYLYVLTDEDKGALLRIVPTEGKND